MINSHKELVAEIRIFAEKMELADETIYDTDSIINSEEENIFCVSSLSDYLKYISNAEIELQGVSLSTEQVGDGVFTSISGKFEFIIKRSPSYWKKMEAYNV